jgi:ribosomal protein S18 acetylase RimI-like enzyme
MSRISLPYDDLDTTLVLLSAWRSVAPFDRLAAYPSVYRLGLLLTSRLQDRQHDARIWIETRGNDWDEDLVGAAMLWSRRPDDNYRALEGPFTLPDLDRAEQAALEGDIIAWAQRRTHEIGQQRGAPIALTTVARQNDTARRDLLTGAGFDEYMTAANVYWERPLAAIDQPAMPTGFTIGALNLKTQVAEYDALYGFAQVNARHRRKLARDPDYAFLVAAAPNSALVAYCEVSVCRREWLPHAPRIGWIDYIGVHKDSQRCGLGRAILAAGLAQLAQWGAERAMLVTTPANAPANALYEAAGFTRAGYEDGYRWLA